VQALIGGNGAGKSTLVSIITGVVQPDAGEMLLDGAPFRPRHPRDALRSGIAAVYQEPSIVPYMSVLDNIMLGQEIIGPGGLLNWAAERARVRGILHDVLQVDVPVNAPAGSLSVGQQQVVEMARALVRNARLLILDEPSAVLAGQDIEHVFAAVSRLSSHGVSVLLISHRLSDITEICDAVTIFRDGEVVSRGPLAQYDMAGIIRQMVGRDIGPETRSASAGDRAIVLDVDRLELPGTGPAGISLKVRAGEVVGIGGLMGSGRSRLVRAVSGCEHTTGGSIRVAGVSVRRNSIRAASRNGIVLIPEDRRRMGLVVNMSVGSNMTLAVLDRIARFGFLDHRRERAMIERGIRELSIKAGSDTQAVRNLSGGSQQKVVLAKWLAAEPKVMLLDEPTRGIDVGAKAEFYDIVRHLREAGLAIVLVSSDLPELGMLSDRVLVMSGGRIKGELPGGRASEEAMLEMAMAKAQLRDEP